MDLHSLIRDYGLLAVFLTVLLEQFGLPLPSLLLLLIVGAVAVADPVFGILALLLASIASMVGGVILFLFGRRYGDSLLELMCRLSLSPHKCLNHGRTAYQRFGPGALIMARFVPGLATMAPPLAGSIGMRFWVFLRYQATAAIVFSFCSLAAGYMFSDYVGSLVAAVQQYAQPLFYLLSTMLAVWLAYVLIIKRSRRPLPQSPGELP